MENTRIRCNGIEYRKGFIEVVSGIHQGYINIETWQVPPTLNIKNIDIRDSAFPEDGVVSNTELEIDVAAARKLIFLLQSAIQEVEKGQ